MTSIILFCVYTNKHTAQFIVTKYLLLSPDSGFINILVLLDLLVSFNTINHHKLSLTRSLSEGH